ncbi:hypothetical protein FRC18_010188 [Serendipita sp. 400]|nr:hypothetical protein FRC18_010188 [Serendipita sp. 400]
MTTTITMTATLVAQNLFSATYEKDRRIHFCLSHTIRIVEHGRFVEDDSHGASNRWLISATAVLTLLFIQPPFMDLGRRRGRENAMTVSPPTYNIAVATLTILLATLDTNGIKFNDNSNSKNTTIEAMHAGQYQLTSNSNSVRPLFYSLALHSYRRQAEGNDWSEETEGVLGNAIR